MVETLAESSLRKKVTEHAHILGVEAEKVRTYRISLDWMLDHGTLVDVYVYGMSLFNTPATLAELGIQSGDVRGRRLRPGRRELIVSHPTAHFYHITPATEGSTVYLGFAPELPPPPAFYFRKAGRVTAIEWFADRDWQTIEEPTVDSRWIPLNIPEEMWPASSQFGHWARWLRLTVSPGSGKNQEPSIDDIICNPVSSLRSVETRCRRSIDMSAGGYGQKFPGFGGFAWIGYKAWSTWLAEWNRLEAELECIKQYILWRYDEFIADLKDQFEELAVESWQAMAVRRKGTKFAYAPGNGCQPLESVADFRDFIISGAMARLPSRETIERKVRIGYLVSLALGQAEVMADKLEAERLQTEIVREQAVQTVEQEKVRIEQRLLWDGEQLERDRLNAERERIESERLAMKEVALQQAREQMAEMTNPYQEMLENLRSTMYQAAVEISASMQKNGGLRGKVADRARNLVDYCRIMNSHDDGELENLLNRLNFQLPDIGGTANDSPSNAIIQQTLNEIIDLTGQAAASIRGREASIYGLNSIEL